MKVRYLIPILLFAVISSTVDAISLTTAREFAAVRKRTATQIPLATLKASPGSYIGKVLELRGQLTGYSKSESEYCLIIRAEDGSYLIRTDSLPTDSTGTELLMLVRIGEGSASSLSDLRLVACTYGALCRPPEPVKPAVEPAAATETAETPKEPARATQEKTSRGKISSEELVTAYTKAIRGFNPKLTTSQANTIARSVLGFSYHYKVDPRLVCAVILAESHFRPSATSRCGAAGLGQLMPSTAAGLGVNNAYDPVENVYGSVRYIRSMLDRMSGSKGKEWNELTWYDLGIALAAYNAGPGAVKKHGGIPPYRETQNYVRKVTEIYKKLCGVT